MYFLKDGKGFVSIAGFYVTKTGVQYITSFNLTEKHLFRVARVEMIDIDSSILDKIRSFILASVRLAESASK